jgi:DNA-binding transcriptional LysR family regulator
MRTVTDLQLLRAFVAVARGGSVSRAAEQLHLSQPAVSLQLKAMADQTGVQLFSRKARGLELTREGVALLPQAERVLASLADFNHAASGFRDAVTGVLRIGTILDPEFTRLGAFLKQLVEAAPRVETDLRQAMSGTVLEQIERGALDVGFYLDVPHEGTRPDAAAKLALQTLTRFTYRVIAPPGWGPRVKGQDWSGLASLPWIATPAQSVHHRLLSSVFGPGSSTGLEPTRVAMVDQEASMLDLVKSGVGLSLMRDSIAIRESQSFGIEIADKVGLDCVLAFVCLRARRDDPVVEAAWSALARTWALA